MIWEKQGLLIEEMLIGRNELYSNWFRTTKFLAWGTGDKVTFIVDYWGWEVAHTGRPMSRKSLEGLSVSRLADI